MNQQYDVMLEQPIDRQMESTPPILPDSPPKKRGCIHSLFRSFWSFCFWIVLLVLLGGSSGALYQKIATNRDRQTYDNLLGGKIVTVKGRDTHYWSQGEGTPPVILESGLFGTTLDWCLVHPEVSRFTQTIAYHRPGYGWSAPDLEPHTARRISENLHTLLATIDVQGPFIFVGHSMGGLYIRYYAYLYPQDVAGMILVDSTPENFFDMENLAKEEQRLEKIVEWIIPIVRIAAPLGILRFLGFPAVLADIPEEFRPLSDTIGYRTSAYTTAINEWNAFKTVADEVRSATSAQAAWPLIVLSQGRALTDFQNFPPDSTDYKITHDLNELQKQFTRISSNSIHIVANQSYHYIQLDEPQLVIQAIHAMVNSVREKNAKTIGAYFESENKINSTPESNIQQDSIKKEK